MCRKRTELVTGLAVQLIQRSEAQTYILLQQIRIGSMPRYVRPGIISLLHALCTLIKSMLTLNVAFNWSVISLSKVDKKCKPWLS